APRQANESQGLHPIRVVLAGTIRAPMRENPSHQLVLILDRGDEKISLHLERPARPGDVMDIHVRHRGRYELPFSIPDWVMKQNQVNRRTLDRGHEAVFISI